MFFENILKIRVQRRGVLYYTRISNFIQNIIIELFKKKKKK